MPTEFLASLKLVRVKKWDFSIPKKKKKIIFNVNL